MCSAGDEMMKTCFPIKRLDSRLGELDASSLKKRNVMPRPSQSPENQNLDSIPGKTFQGLLLRLQIEPAQSQGLISPSSTLPLPYKTLLQTHVLFKINSGSQGFCFLLVYQTLGTLPCFSGVIGVENSCRPLSALECCHTFHTDAPEFPFNQDTGKKESEILHFPEQCDVFGSCGSHQRKWI